MESKKLIVLDLFCGTKSIAKAFEARGHTVKTVDWEKSFNPDLQIDIGILKAHELIRLCGGIPDVIWASPDCTTFSIAAISHHRWKNPETGYLEPVSDYAKFCDKVDRHVMELIDDLSRLRDNKGLPPLIYFVENPRCGMRKTEWMQGRPRYTVTYCQYELDKPVKERRMKPTDIWTNHPDPRFKPMCKNGDPCHAAAPRGARTGTQGLKGSKERSVIPAGLCNHIVDICEGFFDA